MKLLFVATFVAVSLFQQETSPSPRDTGQKGIQNTKHDAKSRQQVPNPPPVAGTVGNANATPHSTDQNGGPIAPEDKEHPVRIVSVPPVTIKGNWTDKLSLAFTGLLALVGIVGIIVAICTLKTIERQTAATETAAEATRIAAEATARSVTLQETALRQWVNIENWRSTVFIPEGGALSLHVQFDVVNPTDLPLTLDYAFIILGDQGGKAGRSNLIPPKKGHPVTTTVKITEEQARKWHQEELIFMVNGYIKFEDALEKERTQPFNGVIGCSGKRGVRFVPPYGPGLYITDENKND
jgi:hypothetical protein